MVNIQKPTSQSEIINLFKRYSKLISTESKLDSAESQRRLYYHILKNIAKTCEFDLPFKIKEYEKNYHSLKQFDFPYDVLLKKSELLDRLFEEIDVEYRRKLGQILTPIQVANFMVSLGLDEKKSAILDPAIGTGIFPNSILLNIKNTSKLKISGFDISKHGLKNAKQEVKKFLFLHNAKNKFPFKNKNFDLIFSFAALHNLKLYDLYNSIKEIQRAGKQNYIMVEGYRNEKELFNLQCWSLTAECFFDDKEWKWIFKKCGYTGDYEFIYFE